MDSETRQRLVNKAETGNWRTMTDIALAVIQLDERIERLERTIERKEARDIREAARGAMLRSRFVGD